MLESIDLLGEQVNFKIKGENTVKTSFGGILTIFTGVIIVVVTWLLGSDVVYRNKPTSYIENTFQKLAPPVYLNKYKYPFVFGIIDQNSNPVYIPRIVTLSVQYIQIDVLDNGTVLPNITNIPLVNCTKKHFPNVQDNTTLAIALTGQCVDNQEFILQGAFGNAKVGALSFSVSMCDWEKTPESCATKEEIKSFLTDNRLFGNMMTFENSLSVKDYKNPLTQYITFNYKVLDANFEKSIQYNIRVNTLQTDSGFFAEEINENSFYFLFEGQGDVKAASSNKLLLTYYTVSSSNGIITHRSYIKVTEIFGSLGGILKLLLLAFNYLNLPVSKVNKYLFLKDFLSKQEEDFGKLKIKSSILISSPMSELKNSKPIIVQDSSINNSSSNIKMASNTNSNLNLRAKQIGKNKKSIYKIIIFQIKKLLCSLKRNKHNLILDGYEQEKKQIDKFFEISNLMDKMNKFEYLNKMILGKEREQVLNLLYYKQPSNKMSHEDKKTYKHFLMKGLKDEFDSRIADVIKFKYPNIGIINN